MVKIKKNKSIISFFVFLLTFLILLGCKAKENKIVEVKYNLINVNETHPSVSYIDSIINPYRAHINKDLDSILAYNPETLDKTSGTWETNIGNLLAYVTYSLSDPIFLKRENKKIDACMLNHGGIRSIIPKGDVTTRTAFNIMPFENSVVVVALNGNQILELANYMLKEKKPHPLYGITIYTNSEEGNVVKVYINKELLNQEKIYYIATSDYLANGGDNMLFFKNSSTKYDLDYKLRNLFIDYFKKVDTLPIIETKHIIEE